ncbi:plasmid mobilization protein [Desertivirga xinjiangensis]|uniref:plasmid mobilization protein n=1 Tax=Desertivirga xinjiangensis TaxID=539206 RepID=UPI00210DBCEF|nr:plasmid mobilization relaxosome protein MobC [Pedobacter xinjiangensis]
MNKIKRFELRLTEDEHLQLLKLERELGISKTELVRRRVLQDSGKVLVQGRELLAQMDKIGTEMGRSGNNINQLAKHTNALNKLGLIPASTVEEFNKLLSNHLRQQKEIEKLMRNLIRLMGNI